jgi:RNA polymerase sigma-70 factor, ECF subfamily
MFDQMQENALLQLRRRLFGYAFALTRDTPSAEDLYQDTMLRAMTAPSAPNNQMAYRVWLFRIMRNLWIDRLRADGRLPEFDYNAEIDDLPMSGSDDQVVNALAVRQAFHCLSKAHRDILALIDICGFSYVEAAEMLDVPAGTIMSRISRARSALARRILDENNIISLPLRRPPRVLGGKG